MRETTYKALPAALSSGGNSVNDGVTVLHRSPLEGQCGDVDDDDNARRKRAWIRRTGRSRNFRSRKTKREGGNKRNPLLTNPPANETVSLSSACGRSRHTGNWTGSTGQGSLSLPSDYNAGGACSIGVYTHAAAYKRFKGGTVSFSWRGRETCTLWFHLFNDSIYSRLSSPTIRSQVQCIVIQFRLPMSGKVTDQGWIRFLFSSHVRVGYIYRVSRCPTWVNISRSNKIVGREKNALRGTITKRRREEENEASITSFSFIFIVFLSLSGMNPRQLL